MKNIEISLDDLPKLVDALESMKSDLEKLQKELPKEIAKEGLEYLNKQYQSMNKDPNITDIKTMTRTTDNGAQIVAYGKDVIYEEFGTGDRGEEDPHDAKNNYNLDDYNSGPFILDISDLENGQNDAFLNILHDNGIYSGKFWSYSKDGQQHLTQGVPSGQEMWNTRNHLKSKEGYVKLLKQKESDMIDKFVKTIKG